MPFTPTTGGGGVRYVFKKAPPPPSGLTASQLAAARANQEKLLGTAGSDYRTMMDFGVSRGYYPGQITRSELPYLERRGTPSTIAALSRQPYVDMGPIGYILQGSAIGDRLLGGAGGGGGGGGGGGSAVGDESVTWRAGYEVPGAPSWWKGMVPSKWNPESEYAALTNAMIPFLSWEDKQAAARSLATLFPAGFGGYTDADFTLPPPLDTTQVEKLRAARRGTSALDALTRLRNVSGQPEKKFGPGFEYLQNIARVLEKYGGEVGTNTRQTRAQYIQQLAQLDPLVGATGGGSALSAFGPIAKMLGQPFVSGPRPLVPATRTQSGEYIFGAWNPAFG